MKYSAVILLIWTTFAYAQQPQNGGLGESCYFVTIKDGKSTSVALKRDTRHDNGEAVYNACENADENGCAALAHHWGTSREIGEVQYEPMLGVHLQGPWKSDGVWLFIYSPYGTIEKQNRHGLRDFDNSLRLANAWVSFTKSEKFEKMNPDEKEKEIFSFLAKEFPNGVVLEDKDPANAENRAFISCQTLF